MVKEYVKNQLSTNPAWALKALVTIYARQTSQEQAMGQTTENNSVGFSGCDSEILSSFAEQYKKWNRLSEKQMVLVFKKMPRYWKQILTCITSDKLPAVEANALNFYQLKTKV